jgi:secondary thiamine-phosphate synthase enzyme
MKQIIITLSPKTRGFHLITEEILKAVGSLPETGILHLFIQHTSAGICINENADASVLSDLNEWFNRNVKENESYYQHIYEGADDMPAHIKSILTGSDVNIPIIANKLALGVWQGIYLGEFRNQGGNRKIIATIIS